MTHLIKIPSLILHLLLYTCTSSVVLAQELGGKIVIDENSLEIEGISVNTTVGGGDEKSGISQSISVGSIVNNVSSGVSSIEIGTVDANDESFCKKLKTLASQPNTTKIIGDNRNISLNSRVSPSVCIKGSQNKIIIQKNARVGELYLFGSDNEIYVANAATVKRVEIVGRRNALILPKEHNIVLKGLHDSYSVKVR